MLYIFGGLPGTGKTTLSRHIACELKAVHLRVDTIEQAIREAGGHVSGPEAYIIAYHIAEDNLRLGLSVVADTVNPLQVTRRAWREVATHMGVQFIEIEVICSDKMEHHVRVETRETDIVGLKLPTWNEVINREYELWDTEHILIDTAGQTSEQSITALKQALACR
jgi:predicted kinase